MSSQNCAILLSCATISDLFYFGGSSINEASHVFLTADDVFLTVAVTGVVFLVEIGIFILAGMI